MLLLPQNIPLLNHWNRCLPRLQDRLQIPDHQHLVSEYISGHHNLPKTRCAITSTRFITKRWHSIRQLTSSISNSNRSLTSINCRSGEIWRDKI